MRGLGLGLGLTLRVPPEDYDADAALYFANVAAAGDSVSPSARTATSDMFVALKSAGLFTKIRRLVPRASNALAGALVRGAGSDGPALDVNSGFVEADYSPSLGLKGGVNKYIDTGVIPNSIASGDDLSIHGYQCSTPNPATGGGFSAIVAAYDSDGDVAYVYLYNSGSPIGNCGGQISRNGGAVQNAQIPQAYKGLFSVSVLATSQQVYVDGCAMFPTAGVELNTRKCDRKIYVHARNTIGTASLWNDGYMGMYAMFTNLTASEMVSLRTIWQAFEVAMGRGWVSPVTDIDLWGDSLTASGYSGNMKQTYFPSGRNVRNMGIGGETSTQIATRMLADPAGKNHLTIIWAGTNNPTAESTVMADIAAMVATLTTSRFIVMTPIVGEDPTMYAGQPNRALLDSLIANIAATYPNNYIDILELLINQYNPGIPQDVIDFGHRIVPSSLRVDTIHLTSAGNGFVTAVVNTFISGKGW